MSLRNCWGKGSMHVLLPVFPALAPLTEEWKRHPTLYIEGHNNTGWASGELGLHASSDCKPGRMAEQEGRMQIGKYSWEMYAVTCLLSSFGQWDCPEHSTFVLCWTKTLWVLTSHFQRDRVFRWADCKALDPTRKYLGVLYSPSHFKVESKCQLMCGLPEYFETGRTS